MELPESPIAGHVFIEVKSDNDLTETLNERTWVVAVTREGEIKGPLPGDYFNFKHWGTPQDIVGFHLIKPPTAEEREKYLAKSDKKPRTKSAKKPQDEAVRPAGAKTQSKDNPKRNKNHEDDPIGEFMGFAAEIGRFAVTAVGLVSMAARELQPEEIKREREKRETDKQARK